MRNRSCWRSGPANTGSVWFNRIMLASWRHNRVIWHYRRRLCNGQPPNMGGPRRPPREKAGVWIEVMHRKADYWAPLEAAALWFYRAAGSGLWFYTGRTLLMSDTIDLARHLNYSSLSGDPDRFYNRGGAISKRSLLHRACAALGQAFDSLVFTHHVDGQDPAVRRGQGRCVGGAYLVEVLNLRGCRLRQTRAASKNLRALNVCPPSTRMAAGWNEPRRRPHEPSRRCECEEGRSIVKCNVSRPPQRAPRRIRASFWNRYAEEMDVAVRTRAWS